MNSLIDRVMEWPPVYRLWMAPFAEQKLRPIREHEVLIEVSVCGVCRTDLHLVDGELPQAVYPVTPGHEIVGRVAVAGHAVTGIRPGDRVGVPWLAQTCGTRPPYRVASASDRESGLMRPGQRARKGTRVPPSNSLYLPPRSGPAGR